MFHNRTLLWYPESNKKNQPSSNMTKLSMLVVLGLAFITMTSAAPYYQRYNNNPFQHFLRYGQMNDNENENYERENKFADNVQNEDDSSSEEDSSESNESSFTSELSSLSSVVGPSSLVAESSMTDPPVEIATATIPLATTTIAMPVETTTTVRETTTVRDTSTPRQVDRGDAGSGPAPGVNSPQVNGNLDPVGDQMP
ncbi:uncharacterized protein [Antedon mediterranea]|uniref:uncharacterized protein isoform X2 n=1 Tax=Antedon mediterranea TaxID=105859 RepID=UPI003AF4467F